MQLLQLLRSVQADQIEQSFDQIANYLFHHCYIQIKQAKYQLTEIEFYYYDAEKHKDVYAHKHPVQLDLGNWYFHGSGLDITFGDRDKQIYAGILIRGIKNLRTNAYTSGPINSVRELMQNFKLVTEGHQLQLIEKAIVATTSIIKSTRIGLNPKRDQENGTNFHKANYRYLIDWEAKIKGHQFKEKLKVREQRNLCTFVNNLI